VVVVAATGRQGGGAKMSCFPCFGGGKKKSLSADTARFDDADAAPASQMTPPAPAAAPMTPPRPGE
jgi:hypothetical protein